MPEPFSDDLSLKAIQAGHYHAPMEGIGCFPLGKDYLYRAFMPSAEEVELIGAGAMQRLEGSDFFELLVDAETHEAIGAHHELSWQEKGIGDRHQVISPYSFGTTIPDDDLYLFGEGKHHHAYRLLGAHPMELDGVSGVRFAVWAPGVQRVSVVGDFNGWNGLRHPMQSLGGGGVWELFIPGLTSGDLYKFELLNRHGHCLVKADPYAQRMTLRPDTACQVMPDTPYVWDDEQWMDERKTWDWQHAPMSIYEVHLGSWRRDWNGGFMSYRALADQLVPYVVDMGYTHIELMPVMEHPLDESWGYQVSGYFAPTARFGSPDELRYLIDACHRQGIGVLLDWVPGHFPRDEFALARFTGEPVYEHPDPRLGEHKDWGTLIFDYGRNEVRNFLLCNAIYWLEEFHIDGLRVDAVASMLYRDYSREEGEWAPNEHGGREHLEAIDFLKTLNVVLHERFPGALTVAEESTAWPNVSRPTYMDGLGFSMKWNMGWMNDTLAYFEQDPVYRSYHHNKLTFSQLYAYSENFVLPLSHDEVVHMKRSLIEKMPGDYWQKFANLRLLLSWMMMHPGKKLLFMGGELGQWLEWSEGQALDWELLNFDNHRGVQRMCRDLNHLYRERPALHAEDFNGAGFRWLECDDYQASVLMFQRQGKGETLTCLLNLTPVPRHQYRIGLPASGVYSECFNSDSEYYGGSNCGNWEVDAQAIPWMGQPYSGEFSLPPLGAIIIQREAS